MGDNSNKKNLFEDYIEGMESLDGETEANHSTVHPRIDAALADLPDDENAKKMRLSSVDAQLVECLTQEFLGLVVRPDEHDFGIIMDAAEVQRMIHAILLDSFLVRDIVQKDFDDRLTSVSWLTDYMVGLVRELMSFIVHFTKTANTREMNRVMEKAAKFIELYDGEHGA